MKTAFICVNYNNSLITIEYINNVLEYSTIYKVEIIIIDNASNAQDINDLDRFIENLKNENVILIKSEINIGYFKGLNLGINQLNKLEYDFVVIGNNDLIFDDNFLQILKSKKTESNVFVIAPNIIRLDGIHQNPHIIEKFSKIQNAYRKIYFSNYYMGVFVQFIYNKFRSKLVQEDRVNNHIEQKIVMGYGACYILTKSFFNSFEALNAPVFLMGEEGILANQVISGNGITLYCPDLIVNHHDHSSIGKVASKTLYKFSQDSYKYYSKNLKHIQ